MLLIAIKKIAADILFLDDPDSIRSHESFDKIGFTSIDFIDFCFEVKSKIHEDADPEYLWPFHKMQADPELCVGGKWTAKGWKAAREILKVPTEPIIHPDKISHFWTPEFCSRRLEALCNG
ncbi:hypothetical protein C4J98_3387 [Pseudomonas orientalis]|uniref:hypothetical protein n=1 Tax=Pseudomonas orientalis TaxID=76758 RepID=UPI000F56401C|nr:hypothetical protein [Pseudomonas orientalis]AZE84793.1 hypothetical protein C4J98_3387 [Pseudomonas orientalis]